MKTLAIKYAPREGSRTGKIFDAYINTLDNVTVRDISNESLPTLTSSDMGDFFTGGKSTDFSKVSAELVEELTQADNIVICSPLYNFGLPAQVKAYVDLVTISGKSFQYTADGPQGLTAIKSATVIATSGGVPFGSPVDLLTPALKTMVNFWAEGDVDVTELTVGGVNGMSDEEADKAVDDLIASF